VLAAALIGGFVLVQLRSRTPLVPFRLFRSRSLTGADLGALLIGAGMFAIFFFLILWMQVINHWSPVKAGLSFLPMTAMIGISAGIASQLLGKIGPRPLLAVGPGLAALGLLTLGLRLEPGSSYLTVILPSLLLVAMGMGLAFVALTSAAVAGVGHEDAGIASALLNAGQQIGGALGLAILTAVSSARTSSLVPGGQPKNPADIPAYLSAVVDGWSLGLLVGAGLILASGIVMFSMVRVSKEAAAAALKEGMAAG
jgi:predicted MFS family arabinose efflux permease